MSLDLNIDIMINNKENIISKFIIKHDYFVPLSINDKRVWFLKSLLCKNHNKHY